MMRALTITAIGLALSLSLTGCYESADVTVYKPGVYKGHKDPLLQGQDRTETLKKRFALVQVER